MLKWMVSFWSSRHDSTCQTLHLHSSFFFVCQMSGTCSGYWWHIPTSSFTAQFHYIIGISSQPWVITVRVTLAKLEQQMENLQEIPVIYYRYLFLHLYEEHGVWTPYSRGATGVPEDTATVEPNSTSILDMLRRLRSRSPPRNQTEDATPSTTPLHQDHLFFFRALLVYNPMWKEHLWHWKLLLSAHCKLHPLTWSGLISDWSLHITFQGHLLVRGLLSSQPMYKPRKDPYRNLHKGNKQDVLALLRFLGGLVMFLFSPLCWPYFPHFVCQAQSCSGVSGVPEYTFQMEDEFQELLQQYQTSDQVRDTLISLGFDCTLTFGLAFSSMQMLGQHIQKFLPPGEDDTTSPACARIRGLCTKCNTIHTSTPIPAAQTFPPTPLPTPTTSVMNSSSNWHEWKPPT